MLFAINFHVADDFFRRKKYFAFVDETATPTQILHTVYGENSVCETWQTPFIHYSPYVIFSSFRPYFAVVCEQCIVGLTLTKNEVFLLLRAPSLGFSKNLSTHLRTFLSKLYLFLNNVAYVYSLKHKKTEKNE